VSLGFATESESAGSASATSSAPAAAHESAGRRRTRSTTAGQKRAPEEPARRIGRNGNRPR
jgi:hypothetical protein